MKPTSTIRMKRPTSLMLAAIVAAGVGLGSRVCLAAPAETCSTNTESRALDFWLGDWNIAGPGSAPNAKSSVTTLLDKCIVVESWDGGRGHIGQNWFGYSPDDKSWHGMFADNIGRVHVFVNGKVAPGSAEFSGPSRGSNGETLLNRVRIVRVGPDKVEQIWEKSFDQGATWTKEFTGEYTRRRP